MSDDWKKKLDETRLELEERPDYQKDLKLVKDYGTANRESGLDVDWTTIICLLKSWDYLDNDQKYMTTQCILCTLMAQHEELSSMGIDFSSKVLN